MTLLSTTLAAPRARRFSRLSQVLSWLRKARAIRRTRASIAHLTPDQLRDIGLVTDDPMLELDEHRRYWHRHLMQG